VWTEQLVPQLMQACVLTLAPARPPQPRHWTAAVVGLPGSSARYPARVDNRRHRGPAPLTRAQLSTCARIAEDIATNRVWRPARPLIVMDTDRPALVLGAVDLETAWARDGVVAVADPAGWVTFTPDWPWHTQATAIRPHPHPPSRHRRRSLAPAPTRPA
jgi:hypothetical protein